MNMGSPVSPSSAFTLKTLPALAVVVLVFATAMAMATVAVHWVKMGLRGTLGEQQFVALSRTAHGIDRQIVSLQGKLKSIAADVPIGKSRAAIQKFISRQSGLQAHFDHIQIFTAKEELIAALTRTATPSGRLLEQRRIIQNTVSSAKDGIAIVSADQGNSRSSMFYSIPILNPVGQVELILTASADLSRFDLATQLHHLKTGRTGYAYMSAEDGTILAHSDPERVLKMVSYGGHAAPAMLRTALEAEGTVHAAGANGLSHLVSTKKLRSGNWSLTAVMPEGEVFGAIVQLEAFFPAVAALLALLAGMLAWYLIHARIASLQSLPGGRENRYPAGQQQSSPGSFSLSSIATLIQSAVMRWRKIVSQKRDELGPGSHRGFLQILVSHLPVPVLATSWRAESRLQMMDWDKIVSKSRGHAAPPILEKVGHEVFAAGIGESLPEQQALARELQIKQAQFAAVSHASPFGLFYADAAGNFTFVNNSLEEMCGRPLKKLLGRRWRHCVLAEDRCRLWLEIGDYASGNPDPYTSLCRLLRRDGSVLWISIKVVRVMVGAKVNGYVGSVEDITARRTSELALLKSEQSLRLITDNIPALVAYVTPDERVAFANRRYEEAYGILHEELFGMHTWEVLGPDVYAKSERYIKEALAGKPAHFEREVHLGDTERHERVSYIPDVDAQGKVAGYFGLVEDITALKQVEAQLRKLVRFDALTGLANRTQLEEKMIDAIRYSRRYETLMAVMFLDIDHFKLINDTLGHQGGDEVLHEFAQRLLACVRETDTVARLAGDEFVIVLEGLSAAEEALAVARKIVDAMAREFTVCGVARRVTTSIGIAVRNTDEEDAQLLLRRADDALYQAKSAGRNTFEMMR